MQDMKIRELQKNIEEAVSRVGEESSKLRKAKELIKSLTDKVSEFYILTSQLNSIYLNKIFLLEP